MNNNEDSSSLASHPPIDDTNATHNNVPRISPKTQALHSRRRLLILIGIALVLLAFILTYVYWYQNPNKVVSDAFVNVLSAKTVNYTGVMRTTGGMKMSTTMDGGISPKGTVINAKFTFDTQNKQYTLTGNGLLDANGDGYVKIKDINQLVGNYRSAVPVSSQPLFDDIIDKINDKWIKISAEDIKNYNADFAVMQKCSTDAIVKIQNDAVTKSTLLDLYKKHPFIAIDKSLGAKGDSLGHSLKINHDVSKLFTTEYKKTTFYKDLVGCDESYALGEDIIKDGAAANSVAVDVWVSRWSHILTKVDMRDDDSSSKTNVSIETKFNHPVRVEVPKNATTLEQLQNDVQDLLRAAQAS